MFFFLFCFFTKFCIFYVIAVSDAMANTDVDQCEWQIPNLFCLLSQGIFLLKFFNFLWSLSHLLEKTPWLLSYLILHFSLLTGNLFWVLRKEVQINIVEKGSIQNSSTLKIDNCPFLLMVVRFHSDEMLIATGCQLWIMFVKKDFNVLLDHKRLPIANCVHKKIWFNCTFRSDVQCASQMAARRRISKGWCIFLSQRDWSMSNQNNSNQTTK